MNKIISENKISKYFSSPFVPYIIIALAVIIFFAGFIFSDKMLLSYDQMNGLDAKVFYKTSILKYHQFPFWFNSRLGGMPTIDAMFGDALYPLSIIINLLVSVPKAIGLKMILHILLAGIFFYLLLKDGFKMPVLISLTGALFYMFNPQFVSHIYPGHDGKMYVIAWVPFLIWQLKKIYEKPSLIYASLLGGGIGMCILTSHIQLTYFVLWVLGLLWLSFIFLYLWNKYILKVIVLLFPNIHSYRYRGLITFKKIFNFTLFFWIGVGIGIAIGAIQLFPSFMYVRDAFSVRGVDKGFKFATSWSMHWPEFFSLWVPEFVNTLDYYWGQNDFKLNSEYAGMIPLIFSVIALLLKPKSKIRIFWIIVAFFTVSYALGKNTFVFYIFYALVPGVKKFRAPSMIMFWFSFSTILLTSLALYDINNGELKNFSEQKQKKWSRNIFIVIGIFVAITILFSIKKDIIRNVFALNLSLQKVNIFEINYNKKFIPFLWLWLFFASSVLLLLRMVIINKLSTKTFTIIIICIGLIDILRVDSIFIKLINPKPYFYRDPALEPLVKEIAKKPFRCYSLPGSLHENGEGIFYLEGVTGFHDNELRWYREFRGDKENRNFLYSLVGMDNNGNMFLKADNLSKGNPFLNIANVKYLLVRDGYKLIPILNKNALERISFAKGYNLVDSNKIAEQLASGEVDYINYVSLFSRPQLPQSFNQLPDSISCPPNSLNSVWHKYTPNYRKVTVDVPADGFIRISEAFYPGWVIKIDGKKEKYYRADISFIALPIKKGKHTIEIIAHSKYFSKAAPVSFVMFGILLLYWGYYLLRKKRK